METKRTVLILGSAGMLGGALMRAFSDDAVVGWDRHDCDVTDDARITSQIAELKPDVIVNAVAYTNVDKAESEPELAATLNTHAPEVIAKVAASIGATFVHVSTAYVFDGTSDKGYGESDTPNPRNVYEKTKLAGEKAVMKANPEAYVVRTNWLFGVQGSGEGAKQSFVKKIVGIAAEKGAVSLVEDEIGSPTYAEDLAVYIKDLIVTEEPGLYHAVNDGHCSWLELAKEAFRLNNLTVDVTPISGKMFKRAAPPPKYSIVVCEKTGPMRHWKEALKDYFAK